MKIAILSPFHPFRGGIAQFSTRLYTELSKSNDTKAFSFKILYPNFLFPGKTQYVTDTDNNGGLIESNRILNTISPITYLSTAKAINRYNPDVLIIPYWMSFFAPIFALICKLLNKNIKIIALVHNAIPHEKRFFDSYLLRLFIKQCNGVIALSEPVKKDIQSLLPDTKSLLLQHPIYDQYKEKTEKNIARKNLNIAVDKKTILFFGLIREYKGLDILIEAMSFLDSTYQLLIAGESYQDFTLYQNLIDKSPLKDNIKVIEGYIPDAMVSTVFSAADVLVLPYRSATQSGVVAISYQLEVPMIVTNVGALGKTISSSKTGLVVDEISPIAISEAIKLYFSDVEQQKEYLLNIKTEKEKLSWHTFSNSLLNFIKYDL